MKHTDKDPPLCLTDIVNELFDMIKPSISGQITEKDLIQSGMADTFLSILIDTQGFWEYDGREMFVLLDGSPSIPRFDAS